MLTGLLIWIALGQEAGTLTPKQITEKIERAYAAAQKDPSEPNVFNLASALIAGAEFQESIKFFRFGIGKYPKSARLHVGLGVALHGARDFDAAVESLCRGADLDPKDTRALYFLGKMYDLSPAQAGEVTRRLGRYAQIYPDNAAAHLHYAMSYWKSRNGQESDDDLLVVDRHLRRAVELDPALAEALLNLGTLRDRQGRAAEAVQYFDRVTTLEPSNATAWYRLSQALTKSGQTSRAELALDRYRELRKSQAAQRAK